MQRKQTIEAMGGLSALYGDELSGQQKRPHRFMIEPASGYKRVWDLIVGALVLYLVVMIPYQVMRDTSLQLHYNCTTTH